MLDDSAVEPQRAEAADQTVHSEKVAWGGLDVPPNRCSQAETKHQLLHRRVEGLP